MLTRDRLKYIGLLEEIEKEALKVNWEDAIEEDTEPINILIKKIDPTQTETETTKLKLENILDIIGPAWRHVPTSRKIAEKLHGYYHLESVIRIVSLAFEPDEEKIIACRVCYCISRAATLRGNYELSGEQKQKYSLYFYSKNRHEQIEEFLQL